MVEVSGSTPLTQRLIKSAERRLDELHAADGVVSYPTAARHATVAVLRELADEGERQMRMFTCHRLRDLADSIERGE